MTAAAVGATMVILVGAADAFGTIRYAAPGGSGSACTQASPCSVQTAVTVVATDGDEVVLRPGDYGIGFGTLIVDDAINVHGASGQPRPRILSGGNSAVDLEDPGARVADVAIEYGGTLNALFLWQGTVERVVVHSNGTGFSACAPFNASVLRDSVCWTAEPSQSAISTSSGGGVHTPRLRNVTAIATGAGSIGIRASGGSGAQVAVRGKNVIARGAADDLAAFTDSMPGSGALIALDHSNYVDVSASGTDASVTGSPTNQTAAPLFANASAGNFRQLAGSPTIDAGTTDPLLGALDIDRQPRVQGAAPDIGADELPSAGGGGGPPGGGPSGGPSNEFSFGKVKKNKRKGTAKLTVNVPGPGELDLAKTKKVKADEESVEAAGKKKLSVRPKGKAKRNLNNRGKAKVRANVTYTPTGGTPNTESKRIKLVKRR
jgi:hypothetical protein